MITYLIQHLSRFEVWMLLAAGMGLFLGLCVFIDVIFGHIQHAWNYRRFRNKH